MLKEYTKLDCMKRILHCLWERERMMDVNKLSVNDIFNIMLSLLGLSAWGRSNVENITPPMLIANKETYFILGIKFVTAFHDDVSFELYTFKSGGEMGRVLLTSDFNVLRYECDLQDEDTSRYREPLVCEAIITRF